MSRSISRCRRHALPVLLAATVVLGASPSAAPAQEATLFAFEMNDQFDEVHTDAELRRGVLVLLGSDRAGSQYNPDWRQALDEALEREGARDGVQIFDVANLKTAPKLIKGLVKRKFPDDPAQPALFDWKGLFATAYGFERKKCNVLVFDRGELVHQVPVEEVEEATLHQIVDRILSLRTGG